MFTNATAENSTLNNDAELVTACIPAETIPALIAKYKARPAAFTPDDVDSFADAYGVGADSLHGAFCRLVDAGRLSGAQAKLGGAR